MSARGQAAIAAVVLLAFSARTPAEDGTGHAPPDYAPGGGGGNVAAPAPADARLKNLIEAQTKAINELNARLKAIEKRLDALEKEKNNG